MRTSDLVAEDCQLFSLLEKDVRTGRLVHRPGNILSSSSLIAGTTVGAGILALPRVTYEAGFVPSSAGLVGACIYSIVTGLLLAEVTLVTMRRDGRLSVSLTSMSTEALGTAGTNLGGAAYLFLHYTLLVAYISRGGDDVASVLPGALQSVPALGPSLFCLLLGGACFLLPQAQLDRANTALVGLVVLSFLGLLGLAAPTVAADQLLGGGDWTKLPGTLPVIALA